MKKDFIKFVEECKGYTKKTVPLSKFNCNILYKWIELASNKLGEEESNLFFIWSLNDLNKEKEN